MSGETPFIDPRAIYERAKSVWEEEQVLVTPFDVERDMVELNRRIEKAPAIIKEYHNKAREAKAKYKHEFNMALINSQHSTAADRRADAELKCEEYLTALDVAEIEYRYMVDTLDALKTKLRGLQSISSLMKAQMFQGGS